jgi:hypothetical protein
VVTQHEVTAKFRVGPKGFFKFSTVVKKRTEDIFAPILQEHRHIRGDYYALSAPEITPENT